MTKTSIAEITKKYIKENPFIYHCLKKGILNHSMLAKHIANEIGVKNSSSIQAISVASIRLEQEIKSKVFDEDKVKVILKKSRIEVKTNISYLLINKKVCKDMISTISKDKDFFYLIEGSSFYLMIMQDNEMESIIEKIDNKDIIKKKSDLIFILLVSDKKIENSMGVLSYLHTLFSENGINVLETTSCWTDTILVIDKKDFNQTFNLLQDIIDK